MGSRVRSAAVVAAVSLVVSLGVVAEASALTNRSDGTTGDGAAVTANVSPPTSPGTGPTATSYGPMSPERPVACGEVIVESTKLANDVGPCPYDTDGVIIGRDNIRLDLNGHRIFGTPRPVDPVTNLATDRGVGVHLVGRSNVEIDSSNKGGTITEFDAGVAIEGGSNNHVYGLMILNNVGNGCGDFGDGVVMIGSVNNDINFNNTISGNGPFDGVGMLSSDVPSTDNVIKTNVITNNNKINLCRSAPDPEHGLVTQEDDGVRMEPFSAFNTVKQNEIRLNGLDGTAAFVRATDNQIHNNRIEGNGFPSPGQIHRRGDGVRIFRFGNRNDVQSNDIFRNFEDGIRINTRATANQIFTNKTGQNGEHDLHDDNPACDANIWKNNTFLTVFQGCEAG